MLTLVQLGPSSVSKSPTAPHRISMATVPQITFHSAVSLLPISAPHATKSTPWAGCRLKVAGIEHCGLCGLAHVGHGRTCPHLNSEVQVATLLGTLKESTESRELIEQATKYLRMIRGDLVQRKRKQEGQVPGQAQTQVLRVPAYAKMSGGGGQPMGTFTVNGGARYFQPNGSSGPLA
jgi:hypothetical protein